MTDRIKVTEPVWSAPAGHTNALDERIQGEQKKREKTEREKEGKRG